MLAAMFSAKGAPGVTSSALTLAAVWPRPVVLIEADPSGSDLVYRCRAAIGGPLAPSPNVLGLVSAARKERTTPLHAWTQRLGCGVDLVPGVTAPSQARGMAELWEALAGTLRSSEVDVIADLGRLHRESPARSVLDSADFRIPVVVASLDAIMHTRELLKDLEFGGPGQTTPLLVGRTRTGSADCQDVDEVVAGAGLIASPTGHLPLDHPGLSALEGGASPSSKVRASHLIRAARTFARGLLDLTGSEAVR